jgi:hypothetical protein
MQMVNQAEQQEDRSDEREDLPRPRREMNDQEERDYQGPPWHDFYDPQREVQKPGQWLRERIEHGFQGHPNVQEPVRDPRCQIAGARDRMASVMERVERGKWSIQDRVIAGASLFCSS